MPPETRDESPEAGAAGAFDPYRDGVGGAGGVLREVGGVRRETAASRGIPVVDCDTHLSEPPDLWTSRAPAALRDRMPRVRRVDGMDVWFAGDVALGPLGVAVIDPQRNKLLGKLSYATFEEMNPAAWDVAPRLELMDAFGIQAQICYQNAGCTSPQALARLGDPALATEIVRIYNEAAAERQRESGGRLFPQAVLPIWDREALVAEARRCVEDLRLTGFTLPDRPEQMGVPSFLDAYWAPFFEICDARAVPIDFHIASGIDGWEFAWEGYGFETMMAIGSMLFYIGNAATIANFLYSGLFDRYPNLRVVSVESGLGWIPFALESLEHQFDEMMPNDAKRLQKRPTEYFRDHVFACYWFESSGPRHLLEEIGVRNVLFETDFPHPTSLYPRVQEHIEETLGHYDEPTRRRVLRDNAIELYHLPL